jgi:hypothetical protein
VGSCFSRTQTKICTHTTIPFLLVTLPILLQSFSAQNCRAGSSGRFGRYYNLGLLRYWPDHQILHLAVDGSWPVLPTTGSIVQHPPLFWRTNPRVPKGTRAIFSRGSCPEVCWHYQVLPPYFGSSSFFGCRRLPAGFQRLAVIGPCYQPPVVPPNLCPKLCMKWPLGSFSTV